MAKQPMHDWYLKEWLSTLGETPSWFEEMSGYTHRIASQLINRKYRWNRDHLSHVAQILSIAPYELLMHPDDAMHLRRLRATEQKLRLAEKQQAKSKKPGSTSLPRRTGTAG